MAGRITSFVESIAERIRDVIERLLAVRVVESSIVLAAQAFLALFPLIIIVYAVIPSGAANGLLHELRTRVGLSGQTSEAMQRLVTNRGTLQSSLSGLSVILVIGSATSFTRALQRVYQYAWGLPKLGLRGLWRGLAWLSGVTCYLVMIGGAVHLIHNGDITRPMTSILAIGLWWWTQFLLLGGRVRWRPLLPTAILTAVAQTVVGLLASVFVPREVHSNERSYGPIGVVFALESWFVVVAGVIVVAAALGASISLNEGPIGAWARGTTDPDSWRRDVPPVRLRRKRPLPSEQTPEQTPPAPQG